MINLDKFGRRLFFGAEKSAKNSEIKDLSENKEMSAADRAHRMLHMPEEIDKLQENLKKIFKEISQRFEKKDNKVTNLLSRISTLEISQKELYKELHDNFLDLKKRVELLELENKNYKDQKSE